MNFSELWNPIGVVVAIAAIIVSSRQNKKKKFAYEVNSIFSVLKFDKNYKSKLEITYDKQPIENLTVLEISFHNIGDLSIKKSEFEDPITIEVLGAKRIFKAEVLRGLEDGKMPELKTDDDSKKIIVEPLLLNSKDSFTINILVDGENVKTKITARIVDVSTIEDRIIKRKNQRAIASYIGMSLLGIIMFIIHFAVQELPTIFSSYLAPFFSGFGLGKLLNFYFPFEFVKQKVTNLFK